MRRLTLSVSIISLLTAGGEGHGFHRPAHQLDSMLRTQAWFDHYLGAGSGPSAAGQ